MAAIAQVVGTKRSKEAELASQPLSWQGRIAFFVLSISLLPVFFASGLESKGYKRKSSEAWSWMCLGAIFWMGVFLFPGLFRLLGK
jgi:hypothetical protein